MLLKMTHRENNDRCNLSGEFEVGKYWTVVNESAGGSFKGCLRRRNKKNNENTLYTITYKYFNRVVKNRQEESIE